MDDALIAGNIIKFFHGVPEQLNLLSHPGVPIA